MKNSNSSKIIILFHIICSSVLVNRGWYTYHSCVRSLLFQLNVQRNFLQNSFQFLFYLLIIISICYYPVYKLDFDLASSNFLNKLQLVYTLAPMAVIRNSFHPSDLLFFSFHLIRYQRPTSRSLKRNARNNLIFARNFVFTNFIRVQFIQFTHIDFMTLFRWYSVNNFISNVECDLSTVDNIIRYGTRYRFHVVYFENNFLRFCLSTNVQNFCPYPLNSFR